MDKNQKYKYETFNLIESVEVIEGMSWEGPEVKVGADLREHIEENVSGSKATEKIAVKYDNYDIFVRYGEMAQVYTVGVALTADDIITAEISHDCRDSAKGEWVKLTIEVPEDSDTEYLRVRLPSTAECYIFGYND